MRKFRILFFSLSLLAFLPFKTSFAEQAPFTIGAVIPLTGKTADYGFAVRNGIELARSERPELFTNLKFLFEDSRYDGKTSVTIFHNLRNNDNIDLAFVWGHGPSQVLAPLAQSRTLPTVVVSGDHLVAKDRPLKSDILTTL